MMGQEQNDLLTQTGPGSSVGGVFRHYWQPAALSEELKGPRPLVPVRLLGEDLVLFRSSGWCNGSGQFRRIGTQFTGSFRKCTRLDDVCFWYGLDDRSRILAACA